MSYIASQGTITFDQDIYNKYHDFIDSYMTFNRNSNDDFQILFSKISKNKFKMDVTIYTDDNATFDDYIDHLFMISHKDKANHTFIKIMKGKAAPITLEYTEYDNSRDGYDASANVIMHAGVQKDIATDSDNIAMLNMDRKNIGQSDYQLIKGGYAYGLNIKDGSQADLDSFNEMIEPILVPWINQDHHLTKGKIMQKARQIIIDDPDYEGGILWDHIGDDDDSIEYFIKYHLINKF